MASTQTTGAEKRNGIAGFYTGKIDGDVMRGFARGVNIEGIDLEKSTDNELGVALTLHFKKTVKKADLVQCDECNGVSDINLDACPFCGSEGKDEGDDDAEDDDAPEAEAASTNDEADEDDDAGEEGEPDDDGGEDDEREVEVAAAPPEKPAARKTQKEAKMPTLETVVTNGAGSKHSLAKATRAEVLTEKDLDRAVAEVEKLKSEVAESIYTGAERLYLLGKKILEINAAGLWKLRAGEKNKTKYRSFDTFVQAELGMKAQQAYAAIDLAKGYDSPAILREIGQTKAVKILQAAPQDREALVEEARAGASVREISSKVKESRAKHGSPKKDSPKSKAGKAGAAKTNKTASARSERVSVTSFEGTKTVKLYAKPASLKGLDLSTLKRAKALRDQPFGRVELANGLVQTINIVVDKNGELALKIETRRED